MEVNEAEVWLCEFYFSDMQSSKKRPVLVFKNNLPFNDFVAVPISSQINMIHTDEIILGETDFSDGKLPRNSKLMLRKTFIVSREVVIKKYGVLNPKSFKKIHRHFCHYFACQK